MTTKTTLLCCLLCCFAITSCSTAQKFVVTGTPGTEIYDANYDRTATIGDDGQVELQVSADFQAGFLFSKSPDSNLLIPFALDYEYNPYKQRNMIYGATVYSLLSLPIVFDGLTLLEAFCYEALMAVGGGTLGYWFSPINYKTTWSFNYLNNQITNQDLFPQSDSTTENE